jgi:invasion protein IalB
LGWNSEDRGNSVTRPSFRSYIFTGSAALAISTASAAETAPQPLQIAALVATGKTVAPGDLLRTTRMFPNWNLNCEVLLSEGRHLCAVELRSVDAQGHQVFAWSIALGADGAPLMVFRLPGNMVRSYGLRMAIGSFATVLAPRQEDCEPSECCIMAPFDTVLRAIMATQQKVVFSLMLNADILRIEAPLAGMSEALEVARRDPIGLLATQHASAGAPIKTRGRPSIPAAAAAPARPQKTKTD